MKKLGTHHITIHIIQRLKIMYLTKKILDRQVTLYEMHH